MTYDNLYFSLYPSCVLVNGKEKDAIYDLQRELYKLIPHSLYYLLTYHRNDSIAVIQKKYRENINVINQYFDFLLKNDFGIICPKEDIIFRKLNDEYRSPKLITNAILDYDAQSNYSVQYVIEELNELRVENIEIRIYSYRTIEEIEKLLSYTAYSCIRDVELLIQYGKEYTLERILQIRYKNPRLRKFTISNCPKEEERIYNSQEFFIIFTHENIKSEDQCGVVTPWYMLPKTELYEESKHFNNCLNQKIGIDKRGEIKNCPSMKKSYGKIGEISLRQIAENPNFQKIWKIRKDDIRICQDCELRYLCQDCRAYTTNSQDIYAKPLKCNYNPLKL